MMRHTPLRRTGSLRRTGRLRSRRKGRHGTVAGRPNVTPVEWKAMKVALFARHSGACAVPWCRRRGSLDPHHVQKRSQGGPDALGDPKAGECGNLVLLCRRCHDATDLPGVKRLTFAPVSSEGLLYPGFLVRQGDLSGFITITPAGASHATF